MLFYQVEVLKSTFGHYSMSSIFLYSYVFVPKAYACCACFCYCDALSFSFFWLHLLFNVSLLLFFPFLFAFLDSKGGFLLLWLFHSCCILVKFCTNSRPSVHDLSYLLSNQVKMKHFNYHACTYNHQFTKNTLKRKQHGRPEGTSPAIRAT